MKFYFAAQYNDNKNILMKKLGITQRILSYAYIQKLKTRADTFTKNLLEKGATNLFLLNVPRISLKGKKNE